MAASENKDAAHAFIDYVLGAETGKWATGNILYKVPNESAMKGLDPSLVSTYPNLGMSPAELLELEALRDIGRAQKVYPRAVTEITASP